MTDCRLTRIGKKSFRDYVIVEKVIFVGKRSAVIRCEVIRSYTGNGRSNEAATVTTPDKINAVGNHGTVSSRFI